MTGDDSAMVRRSKERPLQSTFAVNDAQRDGCGVGEARLAPQGALIGGEEYRGHAAGADVEGEMDSTSQSSSSTLVWPWTTQHHGT